MNEKSNETLIWLHPDCLSASNPAFQKYPDAPALFVFDAEEIEAEAWSLKRIQFLYETLLEMPTEIRRGHVADEVLRHAQSIGARRIATVECVNPRFASQRRLIEAALPLEVLPAPPFVDYRGSLDLRRFARYWKRVEPFVFEH